MLFSVQESPRWTPIKIIAAATAGVFILQAISTATLGGDILGQWLGLDATALKHGQIWRLATYAFVHGGLWPMLFNVLALVLIGFPMERDTGPKAMGVIYGLLTLAGGVAFGLVHASSGVGFFMGASAAAVGLLCLYCFNNLDRAITLLLFFVLPVTLKPRYVLYFTVGICLFGLVFSEIANSANALAASSGYSASMGAILAAWAVSYFYMRTGSITLPKATITAPSWLKKKVVFNKSAEANYEVNLSGRAKMKLEVDRILDKINTKGFGSLSKDEKATLDKAKDMLGK